MSFLDIKDLAERATLVKEYVTAMKAVKQCNMANRELKTLSVDGTVYYATPGFYALIMLKHP